MEATTMSPFVRGIFKGVMTGVALTNSVYCIWLVFTWDGPNTIAGGAAMAWLLIAEWWWK